MPASMVATVTYFGGFSGPRRINVSVPLVSVLLDEPGFKYLVLPPEEPVPAVEVPSPRRRWGPLPRRGGREVIAME